MHFSYAYHTDVGTTREVNQDALVIKTWNQSGNSVFLGAVCDGLGGLARGEEASRRAAVMLSEWFDQELVQLIAQIGTKEVVERRLRQHRRTRSKVVHAIHTILPLGIILWSMAAEDKWEFVELRSKGLGNRD